MLALLAKALGLPKSRLSLVRGQTARVKQVEIEGVGEAEMTRAFGTPNP